MTAGNRRQVRTAIAGYFGGQLVTADAGMCYQGGPLTSFKLGTVFPYAPKGIPDTYFFRDGPGQGWGAVMGVTAPDRATTRIAIAGPTSGWRARNYTIQLDIEVMSEETHVETAAAGLDDLIDEIYDLVFADRTLGTTNPDLYPPPVGRLITQAGEQPYGMRDHADPFVPWTGERGRFYGYGQVSFQALAFVQA